MKRTPLDLAAVATAAVPGLDAVQVGRLPDDPEDFDTALVVDAAGGRWRVRSPKHPEASLRLETELRALGGLSPTVRATLPFAVPTVAGTVKRDELKTFVYHHIDGHVLGLDELLGSDSLPRLVGETLAAVHEIDRATITRAGLPAYTAEEYRLARLAELDQVAASGKVPSSLLRRWENAFEDVSLWRFNPAAVHGDLHEEQLFVHEGRVVAVTGWSDLHVGDPAEDLAWLLALGDTRIIDDVLGSYSARRGDKADPHLMARATLAAEFALARWLARAITRDDTERTAQAQAMLEELATNLAELGDRPIGVVEATPATEGTAGQQGRTEDDPAQTAEPATTATPAVTELPATSSNPRTTGTSGTSGTSGTTLPDAAATAPADASPQRGETPAEPAGAPTEEAEASAEAAPAATKAADRAPEGAPGDRTDQAQDARVDDAKADAAGADERADEDADAADAVITDADISEPETDALPLIPQEDEGQGSRDGEEQRAQRGRPDGSRGDDAS